MCLVTGLVHAQPTITNVTVGTAFRYQGAIRGVFPNSVFPNPGVTSGTLQFQFGLWDDPVNTNATSQMASNLFTTLNVSNGFFSTMLDFGDVFDGRRAFLEVAVYAPSNTFPASSNWITVGPRTEIGAVPYAMWALKGGQDVVSSMGYFTWNSTVGFFQGASVTIPGAFWRVNPFGGGTVMSDFEVLSVPKVIEEARIIIGQKSWDLEPPGCLTCYVAATLEIWRMTNNTVASGVYSESMQAQYVRTLSATTNLVLGTAPAGQWLTLTLTNSVRTVKLGEFLRVAYRSVGTHAGDVFEEMYLRGEAAVRDAP
jgi:hypothetical protein